MIGVIGFPDSVRLTLEVGAEMGIGGLMVSRSYESFEETPRLAAELDTMCNTLLFTGHVPYVLAQLDTTLRARLDFIPHSGTDLYRALGLVLRDHAGRFPAASVDTIGASTVQETCRDLGLESPRHVLSVESMATPSGFRSAGEISDRHRRLFEAGEVELCLTCLGSVRSQLDRWGVPVLRIEHTRLAVRDALTRAMLADRLIRTETSQLTVVLVQRGTSGKLPAVHLGATMLAQDLRGSLSTGDEDAYFVHTTLGAADALLERFGASRGAVTQRCGLPADVQIGVGVGGSGAAAEENARQAVKLSAGEDAIVTVLADGSVRIGTGEHRLTLRETREHMLSRSRTTGIGSVTLARLALALRMVNPRAFTARELAEVYGVEPRSANRLLARLKRAGIVAVAGVQAPPRAGRPQTVYRIDPEKLLRL